MRTGSASLPRIAVLVQPVIGPKGLLAALAIEGAVFEGAHGEAGLRLRQHPVQPVMAEPVARLRRRLPPFRFRDRLTPEIAHPARPAGADVVVGDRLAVAIGAEAGMEVDDGHVLAALQITVDDGVQGAVRPGGSPAAEEHAVGVAVLAARDGAEELDVADLPAKGRKSSIGRRPPGLAEIRRHEIVGDLEIALVRRIRLRMVNVVTVEVVALLRHTSCPGESVGVDGMHEQRRGALRQSRGANAGQPIDLEPRAAIALDAMGGRDRDHDLPGIGRPDPGHVGRQRLALRPLGRIVVTEGVGIREPGRRQKLVARLAVVGGEGGNVVHGRRYLVQGFTIFKRRRQTPPCCLGRRHGERIPS